MYYPTDQRPNGPDNGGSEVRILPGSAVVRPVKRNWYRPSLRLADILIIVFILYLLNVAMCIEFIPSAWIDNMPDDEPEITYLAI